MHWHSRYLQQASWTRELRAYLLDSAGIERAQRVLEVGCGTGAILGDLAHYAGSRPGRQLAIHGVDTDLQALNRARVNAPAAILTRGDARRLPLSDGCFDITCCHFLLLWLSDPLIAIREMRRVTRASGHVLALAEPDYTAREDGPAGLAYLGTLQMRALLEQGADPGIGSHVADLFDSAGLRIVETGTIASQESAVIEDQEWAAEWSTLREDVSGQLSNADLDRLEQMDTQARRSGRRRLYVPTYFVHAQV
jgi:ubiquinone/menaquinone biosynthesis C-methylase UbiE